MAILDYEIGGNDVKIDGSESISDIPENRSLIIELLTDREPVKPETVEGLTTIESVFKHFTPNVDVEFENEEGQPLEENLVFSTVGDFSIKNITEQSAFLQGLNMQKEFYETMTKQLRSNKVLQRVLENAQSKEAFIEALSALRDELETTNI